MTTTVNDIMRRKFPSLKKEDSLRKAIGLFIRNPDTVFPVVENGRIIGEVNQHELLKLTIPADYIAEEHILGPQGIKEVLEHQGKTVEDIMTTHDVKVMTDVTVSDAARIMLDTEVRTLEVVNLKREPVGFVSELDILRYLKKKLEPKVKESR